jgi:hypothetical protein
VFGARFSLRFCSYGACFRMHSIHPDHIQRAFSDRTLGAIRTVRRRAQHSTLREWHFASGQIWSMHSWINASSNFSAGGPKASIILRPRSRNLSRLANRCFLLASPSERRRLCEA